MFDREKKADDLKEVKTPDEVKSAVRAEARENIKSPDAAWGAQVAEKKTLKEKVYASLAKVKGLAKWVAKGMALHLPGIIVGKIFGGGILGMYISDKFVLRADRKRRERESAGAGEATA